MTRKVLVYRTESLTGVGIVLEDDMVCATSPCCGVRLSRGSWSGGPGKPWNCSACGKEIRSEGNGSTVPLADRTFQSVKWIKDWVSVWTGIDKENIEVTIEFGKEV